MAQDNTPDISEESFGSRMLYKSIRSRFPKVVQLSTDSLNEWLSDETLAPDILLVDVREQEEHEISSIKNSLKVTPIDGTNAVLTKMKSVEAKKVIVFCSLGYRSCKLVKMLYQDLVKANEEVELYNLEGGLFKWANENREIVDNAGNNTTFVHPYNVVWEKFLEYNRRYYESTD